MFYTEYLTPSERMDAIRAGVASGLHDAGVTPSKFDSAIKSAQARIPTVSLGALANTAIVAGVPLGLVYYMVSKSLNKTDRKTRRLQKELDYYNDVMAEFKNNYQVDGEGA